MSTSSSSRATSTSRQRAAWGTGPRRGASTSIQTRPSSSGWTRRTICVWSPWSRARRGGRLPATRASDRRDREGGALPALRPAGYLSSCPSNLGTGMRASVLVRLQKASAHPSFKETVEKWHLQARGLYGENSSAAEGCVFDISNRRRLGRTEVECIKEMYFGVKALLELEKGLLWGLSGIFNFPFLIYYVDPLIILAYVPYRITDSSPVTRISYLSRTNFNCFRNILVLQQFHSFQVLRICLLLHQLISVLVGSRTAYSMSWIGL